MLIVTDPFQFYRPEVQLTWGRTCVHVESGKIIRRNRIMRVNNELVWRTQEQLDKVRSRCEDSKKINTAFIERLNLTMRKSLWCLQRKTNSAAKTRETLEVQIDLLQVYYNFVRPHRSLKFGREMRLPAQQAGLVTRVLSWRDVFLSFRPIARLPWLRDELTRREWSGSAPCLAIDTGRHYRPRLVRPTGFEPVACGFGGRGSSVRTTVATSGYGVARIQLHSLLHAAAARSPRLELVANRPPGFGLKRTNPKCRWHTLPAPASRATLNPWKPKTAPAPR